MRRILLIGKNGQVGWELERTLAPLGELVALDRAAFDLTDSSHICAAVREIRPDIIVYAAAYTAVDKAESEADHAMAINGEAPGVLAEEAKRLGALLVHYSTDYVFDGGKQGAYTEQDEPHPLNAYGRSKLAGERAVQCAGGRHLILRTSWVYGLRGHNFLRTIMRLAAERDELRVVDDQSGAPTWCRMIAEATALALSQTTPPEGLFHLASSGATSWFGFTGAILAHTRAQRGHEPQLVAIPTSAYPLPAARPRNSQLDCSALARATGLALPDWARTLQLCMGGGEDRKTSR